MTAPVNVAPERRCGRCSTLLVECSNCGHGVSIHRRNAGRCLVGGCDCLQVVEPRPIDGELCEPCKAFCPNCDRNVQGRWAWIEVVRASSSGPAEHEARCGFCAGTMKQRRRLAEALERE